MAPSSRPAPPVPLLPARWPSRAEAERSRLFSPCRLGPVEARARTWVPAMVPWRATEDGLVTEANLDWYGRFAAGRPGVLVAEATGIRDVPSGPLLRIGHDRFVPGLSSLVERVRSESDGETVFLLQLIDFLAVRRRPEPATWFRRHLVVRPEHRERIAAQAGSDRWRGAPDEEVRAWLLAADAKAQEAVLSRRDLEDLRLGYRERVTDVHLPHVRDLPLVLPGLFADASERAVRAGFHGVELHFAHAYTMASFLSRTNDRADGWGGSREGRVRLAVDVARAVRRRVGDRVVVGARILGDEAIAGGSDVEDAAWYAVRLAEAGLDVVSVSKGGKFDDARAPRVGEAVYPYTGPSGHECMPTVRIGGVGPFGRNVPLAAAVRASLRQAGHETPVVAAGGIATFDQAEAVLVEGKADLVASARQTLADPDWFRKVRRGLGHLVRRCEFTNYCEGLDQRHEAVTCRLWDKDFDPARPDPAVPRSADGRRRLLPPRWEPPGGPDAHRPDAGAPSTRRGVR